MQEFVDFFLVTVNNLEAGTYIKLLNNMVYFFIVRKET